MLSRRFEFVKLHFHFASVFFSLRIFFVFFGIHYDQEKQTHNVGSPQFLFSGEDEQRYQGRIKQFDSEKQFLTLENLSSSFESQAIEFRNLVFDHQFYEQGDVVEFFIRNGVFFVIRTCIFSYNGKKGR